MSGCFSWCFCFQNHLKRIRFEYLHWQSKVKVNKAKKWTLLQIIEVGWLVNFSRSFRWLATFLFFYTYILFLICCGSCCSAYQIWELLKNLRKAFKIELLLMLLLLLLLLSYLKLIYNSINNTELNIRDIKIVEILCTSSLSAFFISCCPVVEWFISCNKYIPSKKKKEKRKNK